MILCVALSACNQANKAEQAFLPQGEETAELRDVTDQVLLPGEYVQWYQSDENQLRKKKVIEDIEFSAQYRPKEYMVCLEERKDSLAGELVKQRVSDMEGAEYFELRIGIAGGEGELLKFKLRSAAEYEKRVDYFAFGLQQDIKLITSTNDTIPCTMFHFERAYDVVPFCRFILGFPVRTGNNTGDLTLMIHDQCFKKGIVKLLFRKEELNNIPKLKTI